MKKSDGSSEIVYLVRNDEPVVEGTPMNAATLNELSTVAGALNAKEAAAASAAEALASQKAAKTSETNAYNSAFAANNSASAAAASQSASKTSETNASNSASDASSSATAAAASQKAAKASETNAANSATNAKASESAAKTSETNASGSASAASSSASKAKTSETNAASSASSASTSSAAASNSATAAAKSETNAKASETAASKSASAAATSETNAKASQTAASNSAGSASSSKDAAAASASAAATSATNAKASQTEAASSASAAASSASAAKTSETNALSSKNAAAKSESNAKDYLEQVKQITVGAQGWFANEASLKASIPNGNNGYWAIVGATDTIWVWDGDGAKWVDTAKKVDAYTKAESDWNFLQHFGTKDTGYNLDADTLDAEGIYRYSGAVKNFYDTECYGIVMVLNTTRTEASGADNVWAWQVCYTTNREIWWRCRVNKNPWHGWKRVANSTDIYNLQNSIKAVSDTAATHTTQLDTLMAWYQNGVKWADVKEKPSYFNVAYDTAKTVDLSGLDQNTWYPVTGTKLPEDGLHKVKCAVQLNSGTKPNWASHDRGFSVNFEAALIASGWGVTQAQGIVLVNQAVWVKSGEYPPLGFKQMTNSSTPVFWLRGGGKYHLYDDWGAVWTVRTEEYTASSQSVSPVTEYPGVTQAKATMQADLEGEASTATIAKQLGNNGSSGNPITFTWSGKDGQPNWLWGANESSQTYVYNPRNFDVAKVNGHTITSGTASLTAGSSPLATGTLYLQYK